MSSWEEKALLKKLDDYFNETTKENILSDLKDSHCLHLMDDIKDQPYIEGLEVKTIVKYNPEYGDNRNCVCGHTYVKHFDSYENMDPIGCKYCGCHSFKEKTK